MGSLPCRKREKRPALQGAGEWSSELGLAHRIRDEFRSAKSRVVKDHASRRGVHEVSRPTKWGTRASGRKDGVAEVMGPAASDRR